MTQLLVQLVCVMLLASCYEAGFFRKPQIETDDYCPICLDKFTGNSDRIPFHFSPHIPISTPNHYFHKSCLKNCQSSKCPLCRLPHDPHTPKDYLKWFCSSSVQNNRLDSSFYANFDEWLSELPKEFMKEVAQDCINNGKKENLQFLVSKIQQQMPEFAGELKELLLANDEEFKSFAQTCSLVELLTELQRKSISKGAWPYYLKLNHEFWRQLRVLGIGYYQIFMRCCTEVRFESNQPLRMRRVWKQLFDADVPDAVKQRWLLNVSLHYEPEDEGNFKYEVERMAPWKIILGAREMYAKRLNKHKP